MVSAIEIEVAARNLDKSTRLAFSYTRRICTYNQVVGLCYGLNYHYTEKQKYGIPHIITSKDIVGVTKTIKGKHLNDVPLNLSILINACGCNKTFLSFQHIPQAVLHT